MEALHLCAGGHIVRPREAARQLTSYVTASMDIISALFSIISKPDGIVCVCGVRVVGVGHAGIAVSSSDSPEDLYKDQLHLWHRNIVCLSAVAWTREGSLRPRCTLQVRRLRLLVTRVPHASLTGNYKHH